MSELVWCGACGTRHFPTFAYCKATNPPVETCSTDSPYQEVKSTGQPHTQFDTGSRRDNRIGKGRFDLLSPIVLKRDAVHMENGARKYEARNWEKGQPLSVYFDSAIRHMYAYLEGRRDEDHLAAARWNIGALMHTEEMVKRGGLPSELADMPSYVGPMAPKETPKQ